MATQDRDVEIIPGTEVLFRHDGSLVNEKVVLIPQPSAAQDDPLNWSPRWKAIVIINQAIFVFISILTPLSIAPLTPIFIQEFHKTLPQVNRLVGAAAITLGYSNLIIVPFSNLFGRRPTILICGLICVLANVWQSLATSYSSFIGASVILGLGAGANESLMPMVIADVMFVHHRGAWMGLYFWAYFLGLFVGPIIAGNIALHVSYRWFFWACTIAQALNLIIMVFLFPETRYRRDHIALSDWGSSTAANTIHSKEEVDGRESITQTSTQVDSDTGPESITQISTEVDSDTGPESITQISTQVDSDTGPDDISPARTRGPSINLSRPVNEYLGTGKPSKAQYSLLPKLEYNGANILFRGVIAPFQIFSFPIILWASFSLGFAANCLLGLNLTQSQVFAAPPYLFSTAQVGFVNFAFVVGGIIGLLTAGPFSDWIIIRATLRNNGVREAEMRLVALVPYVAILIIGMTVSAVGYQRHWPWEVIIVIGYTCVGIQVVGIPAIVISYAVDCYKHLPGQIMVSATIVKNTFGFGMIFFFNNWTIKSGFIPPVITLMALGVGFTVIGMLIFMIWGKQFRCITKNSKLHQLA